MYIRLSIVVPRSSGNWARHFERKVAMSSPFLTCMSVLVQLGLRCSATHAMGAIGKKKNSKSIRSSSVV